MYASGLAFDSMVHVLFMPSRGFFGFSGGTCGGLALWSDLNQHLPRSKLSQDWFYHTEKPRQAPCHGLQAFPGPSRPLAHLAWAVEASAKGPPAWTPDAAADFCTTIRRKEWSAHSSGRGSPAMLTSSGLALGMEGKHPNPSRFQPEKLSFTSVLPSLAGSTPPGRP